MKGAGRGCSVRDCRASRASGRSRKTARAALRIGFPCPARGGTGQGSPLEKVTGPRPGGPVLPSYPARARLYQPAVGWLEEPPKRVENRHLVFEALLFDGLEGLDRLLPCAAVRDRGDYVLLARRKIKDSQMTHDRVCLGGVHDCAAGLSLCSGGGDSPNCSAAHRAARCSASALELSQQSALPMPSKTTLALAPRRLQGGQW